MPNCFQGKSGLVDKCLLLQDLKICHVFHTDFFLHKNGGNHEPLTVALYVWSGENP